MERSLNIQFLFCWIFILVLCSYGIMRGQDDQSDITYEIKKERILGEHYFTPNNVIKSPFILTHVRSSLGVGGITNLKYPLLVINDEELAYLQGDIFAAVLIFEYQHAVKDWLAVWTQFSLTGRLGNTFGSLMKQGINYATTFDIGWLIKVFRNNRFAVSASFEVTNGDYSIINLRQFIYDIVNNIDNSSLTKSNNSLYGLTGLKAAYGINDFFGLNIFFDVGYGETIQRQFENKWFTRFGINTDMNFTHLISAPLSLSLGYFHSSYPRNNNDAVFSSNVIISQISYIGRTDFILSLDLSFSRELTESLDESVWLKNAMFSMRYLF